MKNRRGIAAAIRSAQLATAQGRSEDAQRFLKLALAWCDVPQADVDATMARLQLPRVAAQRPTVETILEQRRALLNANSGLEAIQ